ncbi:saccharopine dehydrogenase [Pholiota conissans]|uniref:Saccharopine dehydrogenase n=1 Tax=Pholiota conissans TaxID=109636 RepID=A0A9P5YYH6_9AGAR|nr:saccharopine dehydrogenase [Pholiota conissans]
MKVLFPLPSKLVCSCPLALMTDKADILILGATGYTGGLIARYLSAHPQRSQFTLAVGARSPEKLKILVQELALPASVKLVKVDVTNLDEVDAAVMQTRVVINTVGPYWLWGTPVVRACVRHGVHYVDLTGETVWVHKLILELDYYATKTGAIIVPACGFDSMPSDISAYLANKTLKSLGPSSTGEYLDAGNSLSAQQFIGGISGGTVSTAMVVFGKVPKRALKEAGRPYSTSPVVGIRPAFRFLYDLPVPGSKTLTGALFFMAPSNKSVVQRTFGLFELQKRENKDNESALLSYGPRFCYDEFMVTSGPISAVIFTVALVIGFGMLLCKPIRNFIHILLPQSGDGPTDEQMQKGFLKVTNITTSSSAPPVEVKTVIKGKGDPGYLLSALMISESALCFLLPPVSAGTSPSLTPKDNVHALPALGRQGGVLTTMTAFGDELIRRLEETGRFEFSSSVVEDTESRKRV